MDGKRPDVVLVREELVWGCDERENRSAVIKWGKAASKKGKQETGQQMAINAPEKSRWKGVQQTRGNKWGRQG